LLWYWICFRRLMRVFLGVDTLSVINFVVKKGPRRFLCHRHIITLLRISIVYHSSSKARKYFILALRNDHNQNYSSNDCADNNESQY
jgi:hypothetical protein